MIVIAIGLIAAVATGIGYVLQQRVAARARAAPLSLGLLQRVLRRPLWWAGLVAMAGGQGLGGWAMGMSTLALVEPLLALSLLVAFAFAAALVGHTPRWQEIVGGLLIAGSLGVFLALSGPHSVARAHWDVPSLLAGAGAVAIVVGLLVGAARRSRLAVESVLIALAAGVLYGLQDVGVRGAWLALHGHGVTAIFYSPWPYLVAAAALGGLLLTQSAYRAGRLDYALPPATAAEPVVGIALGVGLLGDRLSTQPAALAVDAVSLAALVGGVVLIGRSPALSQQHRELTTADR